MALKRKPSNQIIALCLSQDSSYAREVTHGFNAQAANYSDWEIERFDSIAALLTHHADRKRRIAGVVGTFTSAVEVAQARTVLGVPMVAVGGSIPGNLLPMVVSDDERAAVIAAEHLLAQGFTHFAFCGVADAPNSEARWRGFQQRLSEAGHLPERFEFSSHEAAEHPPAAQIAALSAWLGKCPRPAGLLLAADAVGEHVLRICKKIHIQIPQDVALVSVGYEETEHRFSAIAQTHVVLATHEIGVRAARLLAQLLDSGIAPSAPIRVAPLRLVEAQSSNLLAVSDRQLERALRFIRTHHAESLTVEQIARHAGLARRTLEKRFRAVLNRSPKEELDRIRLARIRELLASSDDKLDAIAREVGLQDAKHLNVFFSLREGLPPGEFRRLARPISIPGRVAGRTATALLPHFEFHRIPVGDVRIACEIGGSGPPVLLLHGFPQDRLMWRKIAPVLALTHTVICADLRGYGDSDAPPGDSLHLNYSKRTMAQDQTALMKNLGYDRFIVIGHDRGGRVGHRMALDTPEAVEQLVVMDIVPTATVFETVGRQLAHAYYHWFFLSQPFDLPERLLGADPGFYVQACLERWCGSGVSPFGQGALEHYRARWQSPERIHASCEDYRAAATIDLEHDRDHTRHKISCPLLVLWGAESLTNKLYDVLADWKAKASGPVSGRALPCGHFLPEEAPEVTVAELTKFLNKAHPAGAMGRRK